MSKIYINIKSSISDENIRDLENNILDLLHQYGISFHLDTEHNFKNGTINSVTISD
jgi:hypothetical protein